MFIIIPNFTDLLKEDRFQKVLPLGVRNGHTDGFRDGFHIGR